MREFTEQELVRRDKLNKIKELGIDPFGHRFEVTDFSKNIKDKCIGFTHEELEEKR